MTTLHDTYCAGLRKRGYVRLPKRNRYTMFVSHDMTVYIFVGANGALRMSDRPNAQSSMVVSDVFKRILLGQDIGLVPMT